jgi:hypothetical protein
MENLTEIKLVVLGSILALATSFIVELYKGKAQKIEKNENVRIILRLELDNIFQLLEKLLERYSSSHFYDFRILEQIGAALERTNQLRRDVAYVESDSLKEKILKLLNETTLYHSDTVSVERRAFNPDNTQQGEKKNWDAPEFSSQRQIIATRTVDLKRKFEDILNSLN